MGESTNVSAAVQAYLGMPLRPVGIKVLKPGQEAVEGAFEKLSKKATFCRYVREAAKGKDFLMKLEDLNCANAEVTLGFREPKFVNIEPRIKDKTAAVRIGPVEGSDVVILILNAEQVMTVSILLEGVKAEFKGNMAVCGEAVAHVLTTGLPNVSFLCNGARTFGTYETNEVVAALPLAVFMELPARMAKYGSLSRKAKDSFAQLLLKIK